MPNIFVRPPNFKTFCSGLHVWMVFRSDSRFAPSQWETVLLCNAVSHWLGTSLESSLVLFFSVAMQTVWASFCVRVVFHPITEVSVGQLANGCIREGVMAPALGMAGVRDEPPTYGIRWGHARKVVMVTNLSTLPSWKSELFSLKHMWHGLRLAEPALNLIHLTPGQNGRHFTDDIFKCVSMNEKLCILIWISIKFVLKGLIDKKSPLAEVMAWCRSGDKPLPQPMLTQFTTHIREDELRQGQVMADIKQWDRIIHQCLMFNGILAELPLKLRHGWVITSHRQL